MILVTIFRQPLTLGHTTRVLLHIMKLKMFQKSIKTNFENPLTGFTSVPGKYFWLGNPGWPQKNARNRTLNCSIWRQF